VLTEIRRGFKRPAASIQSKIKEVIRALSTHLVPGFTAAW